MRHLCTALLAIFTVTFSSMAQCQDSFETLEQAKARMATILSEYVSKDPIEAIRKFPRFPTARTDEEHRQTIQKFVTWHVQSSEKRGATLSFQFHSASEIGSSVARLRFLVLTERLPVVFDFYFYRQSLDAPWKCADITAISGIAALFKPQEQ